MSNSKDQTAFPMMPSHTDPANVNKEFTGLTKREYFAGLAMQGILASKNAPEDATYGEIVFDAVALADTLINELNKNK